MSDEQVPQNNPYYPPVSPAQFYPPPLSVKDWLVTLIIAAIPLVGIIMLFIWAFSSDGNIHKKNFSKALLLFTLIMIILYIVLIVGMVLLVAMIGVSSAGS